MSAIEEAKPHNVGAVNEVSDDEKIVGHTPEKGSDTEEPPEYEAQGKLEHGHLQELEVDLGKRLVEAEVYDVDSDHSPYPEGQFPLLLSPP